MSDVLAELRSRFDTDDLDTFDDIEENPGFVDSKWFPILLGAVGAAVGYFAWGFVPIGDLGNLIVGSTGASGSGLPPVWLPAVVSDAITIAIGGTILGVAYYFRAKQRYVMPVLAGVGAGILANGVVSLAELGYGQLASPALEFGPHAQITNPNMGNGYSRSGVV